MNPTQEHAAEEKATSDPHDEMTPQKNSADISKLEKLIMVKECCTTNISGGLKTWSEEAPFAPLLRRATRGW